MIQEHADDEGVASTHVAITCDGVTLSLYVNGELNRTAQVGAGVTLEAWLRPTPPRGG